MLRVADLLYRTHLNHHDVLDVIYARSLSSHSQRRGQVLGTVLFAVLSFPLIREDHRTAKTMIYNQVKSKIR